MPSVTHSPWYLLILLKFLCKLRARFVQRYNLGSYYHEKSKINENHQVSVVARLTNYGPRPSFRQRRTLEKFATVYTHHLSTTGGPTQLRRRMGTTQSVSTLGDLKATRKCQSCHKLLTGISLHSPEKSMNWSRKSNDIPQMLLPPLRRSAVALILLNLTIGGNSST